MGIAGHILGPKKLRRLATATGLPLDRAINRNGYCEGVVWTDSGCQHFEIDLRNGTHQQIDNPGHWSTCNPANRGDIV